MSLKSSLASMDYMTWVNKIDTQTRLLISANQNSYLKLKQICSIRSINKKTYFSCRELLYFRIVFIYSQITGLLIVKSLIKKRLMVLKSSSTSAWTGLRKIISVTSFYISHSPCLCFSLFSFFLCFSSSVSLSHLHILLFYFSSNIHFAA